MSIYYYDHNYNETHSKSHYQVNQLFDLDFKDIFLRHNVKFIGIALDFDSWICCYYIPIITALLNETKIPFFPLDIRFQIIDNSLHPLLTHLIYDNNLISRIPLPKKDVVKLNQHLSLCSFNTNEKFENQNDIVYAVQTSGTTGHRKIVYVSRNSVFSNVKDFINEFQDCQNIVICAPPTFDPFYVDVFLGIQTKKHVHFLSNKLKNLPRKLSSLINSISCKNRLLIQMTPSLFKTLEIELNSQITFCLGGEPFPSLNLTYFGEQIKFYNVYGMTEMSCWQSMVRVKNELEEIPIYDPSENLIQNTELILKDKLNLRILEEENIIGIIWIKSSTRICFNENLEKYPEEISTGDLGILKNRKKIYYRGRSDDMIKIKGKRIHLREIEKEIKAVLGNAITDINCCVTESSSVVAFIITESITERDIFNIIKNNPQIPNHYIPHEIVLIPEFPFNYHGKIDNSKLLKVLKNRNQKRNIDVKDLWIKYTNQIPELNSNFIHDGGDSHLAILFAEELSFQSDLLIEIILNGTFGELINAKNHQNAFSTVINSRSKKIKLSNDKNLVNKIAYFRRGIFFNFDNTSSPLFPEFNILENKNIEIQWKIDMKKCIDASPLITNNDEIYLGSHSGLFIKAHLQSGRIVWSQQFPHRIESSPILLDQDSVIFGCYDCKIYSCKTSNGEIIWSFETDGIVKASPIIYKDSLVIVGSYDHYLYCLNNSGKLMWKIKYSESSITTTPVIQNQTGCSISLNGSVIQFDILNAKINWQMELKQPVFSSPVISENILVVGTATGALNGLNFEDGLTLWTYKVGSSIFSSIAQPNPFSNEIAFGCHDHFIYYGKIYKSKFELIWKLVHRSEVYATPVILNNSYLISLSINGQFKLTDLKSGENIIETNDDEIHQTFSSPGYINGILVVGSRNNFLYAFKLS